MTDDDKIEKAIDEALTGFEIRDEHIKRRKPRHPSFRILSREESKIEIEKDSVEQMSVMTKPGTPKVTVDDEPILGIGGDMNTIENIIRKHQQSKKFSEK
jgi:hypothetical protein